MAESKGLDMSNQPDPVVEAEKQNIWLIEYKTDSEFGDWTFLPGFEPTLQSAKDSIKYNLSIDAKRETGFNYRIVKFVREGEHEIQLQ